MCTECKKLVFLEISKFHTGYDNKNNIFMRINFEFTAMQRSRTTSYGYVYNFCGIQ